MRFFETKNYGMFMLIDGNRDVKESRVKKLAKSIEKEGQIEEIRVNPTKINGKYAVTDGQHRLAGCVMLEIPVKVLVNRKDVPLTEIIATNSQRNNWTLPDLVKSYAQLGNPEYIKLLEYYEKFNKKHPIGMQAVAFICRGSMSRNSNSADDQAHGDNLKDGTWRSVLTDKVIMDTWEKCKMFADNHDMTLTRPFVHCVQSIMINEPSFDLNKLLRQSMKYKERFVLASRKQDMLRMFEEVYNHNTNSKNRRYLNLNKL